MHVSVDVVRTNGRDLLARWRFDKSSPMTIGRRPPVFSRPDGRGTYSCLVTINGLGRIIDPEAIALDGRDEHSDVVVELIAPY